MGVITEEEKDALRQRYAAERDKRIRPEGNAQYIRLEGQFGHYLDDPYLPVQERGPVTDHVTFAFVGAGFAGLLAAARLKEAGIDDVRLIDKAGDVGGTWYWNRYPGAQCDTAAFVYLPLLEETGHMPSQKYVYAPEILEHCQRIAKQFGLYEHALFHTQVTEISWDDDGSRWRIRTSRGDDFTAQFLGMGTGPLHVPKLPGIPGVDRFQGHSFHTSRWDYDYTGGDPQGAPMDGLADKRVAIIGTGATSVQAVPHLARDAGELYVFQRTPSSVDIRNNHPIDPEWFADMATPGWQQRWLENFTQNQTGMLVEEDLVQDGWTDLARRVREKIFSLPPEEFTPQGVMAAFEDSDFEKMSEIRARVDSIVTDHETAQDLKAWYRQLCKRPCFHDEYLQSYNVPTAHLVDTGGQGVQEITEAGVVVDGVEYPVDCIIYASGFEVGTEHTHRAGFDIVGRGGEKLSEHWGSGMRTLHGMHVHGFPNAFQVQLSQGANLISNVPHNFTEAARTITAIVRHAIDTGATEVEATREAEDAWVDMLLAADTPMLFGNSECTPGYYNNEGQPLGPLARFSVGYPGGAWAFFQFIDGWRRKGAESGEYEGLEFR